ncbi:MAG: FKBP-type peptidylprolyl isomerase [Flavobacteriaceae bacterium]|nr:FKBP-type peptidylprolyl isomerase [Flavobacteriaceae bacterium]
MNKFRYYFILLITTLSLFSCSKDDSITVQPLRDYQEQFTADNIVVEEYLNSYYMTVTNNSGKPDDQDVEFTKIPVNGTQPSIMSYLNKSTFPKLLKRDVAYNGITYKMYYLVLRPGSGESPCNVDGVLASYKGTYLQNSTVSDVTTLTATSFEDVLYPQQFLSLYNTIPGWGEIFPQFKTGDSPISNADGTVTYNNFGAGVMFIPSGLAYYASGSNSIPSYVPLIFKFKLYAVQRLDQDGDGIPSYLEDLDGDGYMYGYFNTTAYPTTPADIIRYADDTDKDGIPNFLDVDDDADGVSTLKEITATNGSIIPFNDIPSCSGNTTDPSRIKRHLVKCN